MSTGHSIALFRNNPEAEAEAKAKFADALIRYNDPNMAAGFAFETEPAIMGLALSQWVNDPYVQQRINDHFDNLPTASRAPQRDAFASEILQLGRKANATDDKLKCFRLYAEVQGFITKGPVTNNNDNRQINTQQNLFVVPAQPVTPAEEAAEEQRAITAQRKLAGRAS